MNHNTAGMTTTEKIMSKIPGTHEHKEQQAMQAGMMGTGMNTGYGATGVDTGYTGTGMAGAGHHTAGHHATAGMTTTDKLKAAIPGTAENREKKMMQGEGVHYSDTTTGVRDQGYPAGAGTTTGMHGTGKPMATKIKEHLPGTQENKLHKVEKEMHRTY